MRARRRQKARLMLLLPVAGAALALAVSAWGQSGPPKRLDNPFKKGQARDLVDPFSAGKQAEPDKGARPAGSLPPSVAATGPQTVTVGLYLQNLPEIDIRTNSFRAEVYLWFVWKGDLDPTKSFQLTNATSMNELTSTAIFTDDDGAPKPEVLPDGSFLQQFHVYGQFGQPFPLGEYPFDDHDITISMEDARYSMDRLVHALDVKGTAMRPDLVIPGWRLGKLAASLGRSQFATNFGDTRVGDNKDVYSKVEWKLHIERPPAGIVSKTVIPIAIVILITFGAFFCQPQDIDARLCLTITALISAVALQFTAAQELPPTGSLLLLDKIYILSYVAILAVTFACIAANRAVHAERAVWAARIDRWGLIGTAAGYFGTIAYFINHAR